jgi:Xaa-Pro aminopeptidase
MADFDWRFARARRLAADDGLDGLYVTAGPNFVWLTGEHAHPGGWPLWLSAVFVPVDGPSAIVVSKMHAEIFDFEAMPIEHRFTYVDGEPPHDALRAAAGAAGLTHARLGADPALWLGDVELLRAALPHLGLAPAPVLFARLRAVKDHEEIAFLRAACAAHDAGYAAAREILRPGMTVAEAGFEIVRAMVAAGSEELSIVGSFSQLTTRPLAAGEVVDVDLWPGSYRGYHADSARNFFLGEPSADAVRLYTATERAYDAAVAAVRPGVTAESVHAGCTEVMREAGFEQVWKVGHGVGLAESHEGPLLQTGNTDPIEENMVFTIDPGAFLARARPVHIEDTVLVTSSGCESLNAFPREIQVLG